MSSCAYHTANIYNGKYFAIKKQNNGIACYAIYYNSNEVKSKSRKISSLLKDLNQLLLQSKCYEMCDNLGCVFIGTGDYAVVYQIICKSNDYIFFIFVILFS